MLILAKQLVKNYGTKKNPLLALDNADVEINQGEFVVILGRSGSGKSTLLNLMAGLDVATSGELIVDGTNLSKSKSAQLSKYRAGIGIIFQFYNLLPNLNTLENVLMGSWAGGKKAGNKEAADLLEQFGLSHRLKSNVKNLSGGEKQRVSIARSLMGGPKILFCDEPTGALDSHNEDQVKQILIDLNKAGLTIVMVTHNPDFAKIATQTIRMGDGKVLETIMNNNSTSSATDSTQMTQKPSLMDMKINSGGITTV